MTDMTLCNEAVPVAKLELRGSGGIRLMAEVRGAGGPTVLLFHGAGQTSYAWRDTAERLARVGMTTIAVDHRGHGESDWSDDYRLDRFRDDVKAVVEQCVGRPAIVGTSLGGISCLLAQAEEPRADVAALVLVDVAPELEAEGVDRILRFMNANLDGFATTAEAADTIAEYLPHRERRSSSTNLGRYLRRGPQGRYHWHWDPAFLRSAVDDHLTQTDRLKAAASNVDVPTLLVRGAKSDVLGSDGVDSFLSAVPRAEAVTVDGATHTIVGDENDAFSSALVDFLVRTAASPNQSNAELAS